MSTQLLDILAVEVKPGHKLLLTFETGEQRIFSMSTLLTQPPFNRLQDPHLFELARIDYGTVVWPGNIDIAPETLYDLSHPC